MTRTHWTLAPTVVIGVGGAVVAVALTWWALVFGVIVSVGALTVREAGTCLFDTSGLCRAIATLCTQEHLFGVRVYTPHVLWTGLSLLGPGLCAYAIRALREQTAS